MEAQYPLISSFAMTKFEGMFEDLDVHTQVMGSSMATLNTPEGLPNERHAGV